MPSLFTWIDHSDAERRRMLDAIELFRQRGTRDELGLSSVRDGFADLMFPGTGSLQTRARYFFFIPWMYQLFEAERLTSTEIGRKARQFEVRLINALADSADKDGVIGIQKRAALQRLPSSIYWNGLKKLGIRLFPGGQDDYHKSFDRIHNQSRRAMRNDDGEAVGEAVKTWRPGMPRTPVNFPQTATLLLRAAEAEYLRERILADAGSSLLAWFVARVRSQSDHGYLWEHPFMLELPALLARQVHHARNFAEVMHGAPIVYNILLAQMEPRRDELLPGLLAVFDSWSEDVTNRYEILREWQQRELKEMWGLLGKFGARISGPTIQFVEDWADLALGTTDRRGLQRSREAELLITSRERALKRGLARLVHKEARERWNGYSGLDRLEYRWRNAQTLLNDIVSAGEPHA